MEETIYKCRTCLKNNARTFALSKPAIGCSPKKTYAHLLKEFAKLEFDLEQERNLPQYLCSLCCRQLRNTYAFVRQAQYCNSKLIKLLTKQLDCLREQTIDFPSDELNKSVNIKLERDSALNDGNPRDTTTDAFNIKNETNATNVFLKDEILEDIPEENALRKLNDGRDEEKNNQNQTHDVTVAGSSTSDNISTKIVYDTTESSETCDPKVACPICKKLISRRDNLIKHMRVQHDIKDPSTLLEKQKTGPKEQIFPCEICPCKYTNKYSYLNHLMHKHGINQKSANKNEKTKLKNKLIKCRSCEYTAKTYAALHYHNRSKHGTEDDKFKCTFCTYMCLKKFDLLVHVKNVHKEQIKTLKAEKQTESSNNSTNLQDEFMKADLKNESNQGEISENPTKVEDSFISEIILDENSDNESSDDNIPLAQKVIKSQQIGVNNEFEMYKESSDEEFIRNILNIKKRQPKSEATKYLARKCEECGNIYKNHQALYAHQRHVHIPEDKYSLCSHCGKKYKRKSDLRNHIEKAHRPKNETEVVRLPPKVREKRFMCTECSYVCSTITILKIHMNRHHTGEKPYKCDICYKSFIVPYDLKVHRYLHTGERPYKCPICLKGFRDNSHMVKHKRIHSGERPYKCKDCGKCFAQSYNLSVHKRTHLKEKKLNCPICDKLFESKSLLNIHRINENHHDEAV